MMTRDELLQEIKVLQEGSRPGWVITSEWTNKFLTLLAEVLEKLPCD